MWVPAVVLGSACGLIGALPSAFLLERALRKDSTPTVAGGIASIMVSFALLTCTILVAWLVSRRVVLVFGVAEVASFLLVWSIEAVRAWRDAQRGASPGERKRGEPTR